MKFIRIILFPIVPIYYVITWLRNWLYDLGLMESKSYDLPIICVGNLSTGGTGKTPMIEYLISILKNDKIVATLSRGYKRKTKGFLLADDNASAATIGDEPFQFYNKFENILVAVDSDRQNGIATLLNLQNQPDIILLDDAYQHRKVKADYNILLTAYNNLYFNDIVLPTGNLREPRHGRKRADIVIVTKCPIDIEANEKKSIKKSLKLKEHQKLFFSSIVYSDTVFGSKVDLKLKELNKFTLVTGIANPKPLVEYLISKDLVFDHLEFPDHHNFKPHEIDHLCKKELILTTEKDYVRLAGNKNLESILFYLPIKIKIEDSEAFNNAIQKYVG